MAPDRRSRTLFCVSLLDKGVLLALPAVLLACHLAFAAPSQPAKKVLLLYSYQAVLPTAVEWDGAIRMALEDSPTEPKEFYTEFLDLAQFPDEAYLQNLLNLLKSKYVNRKIDLLIPVGDLAFSFLQAHAWYSPRRWYPSLTCFILKGVIGP